MGFSKNHMVALEAHQVTRATLTVLQLWLISVTCFGVLRSYIISYMCFINCMSRSRIWMLEMYRISIFSWKTLFFVFLGSRNHQTPGSWLMDARHHQFSSLCSFHKTTFLDSLTVEFMWNFDKWSITCCSLLWRWRFELEVCR